MTINKKKYSIVLFLLLLQISVSFADGPNMIPSSHVNITFDNGFISDGSVIRVIDNSEYFFSSGIKWQTQSNPFSYTASKGSDIYFGILSPDRDKILTWSSENNQLQEGYVTYYKKLAENELNISKSYLFSGNEAKGMYLLFVLLVEPDADPKDISKWQYIDAKPFFKD